MLPLLIAMTATAQRQPGKHLPKATEGNAHLIDTRIDNMGYWRKMAEMGYVEIAPFIPVEKAIYTGSRINSRSVRTEDSPDVPVTSENSTQSENSVFVNPNDNQNVLQSNNSTTNPVGTLYGANDFYTFDGGETWGGELEGAGGTNSGDPAAAISSDGTYYVGYIHENLSQGVSYSTDQGQTWTAVQCAGGGYILDKNHLWVDNSPSSTYNGHIYSAWTNFQGGANDSRIEIVRSTDGGLTYSSPLNISGAAAGGSHDQGVNINTGPDGQVYAVWAIYDSWPADETALGFARSYDGGVTFEPATRILANIRGIRTTETSKNHRVNSFPSMAVDISNGPDEGTIYIVWPNIGVPGENIGPDIDVYMIKSADEGETWSDPVRVNQDPAGLGKEHYFPWITCDQEYGTLSVIFYDDRNVESSQCEVFCAVSSDDGETWEDFKVSDVSFTPAPIPGLAGGYMGDYLGISCNDRMVYPVWSDNRLGYVMAFVSPFMTGPPPNQPWIIYESHQINDIQGNDNGQADFGESLFINLTMKNIGDQPAIDVVVTLSTENTFVSITDDSEDFGDMEPEQTKFRPGAFELELSTAVPNGEEIEFRLTATDANDSIYYSYFNIIAHAPELVVGQITIADTSGNDNGQLDPGETVDIIITNFNTGDLVADSATATLSTNSEFMTLNTTSYDLGDIGAGSSVAAVFSGTVSEDAPIGSAVTLEYAVNSEFHSAEAVFVKKIGLILEDFETGDFSRFPWSSSTQFPWQISTENPFEGEFCIQSGPISNDMSSNIKTTYTCVGNDSISFYRKVSSEENADYLQFYIDNSLIDQWSGLLDWERVSYPVTPGVHSFRWEYVKDFDGFMGSDRAWVDYIVFPQTLATTCDPGPDTAICEGVDYQCLAIATNYTSLEWQTSGTGTFSNVLILDPIYYPSQDDYEAGSVILSLTAYSNLPSGDITRDMVLTFIPAPDPPDIPEGPQYVDLYYTSSSEYSIQPVPGAASYGWILAPEIAGWISGSDILGTVEWNLEFTGMAQVSAQAFNDCGGGEFSESLEVMVNNTVGYDQPETGPLTFSIQPNPTEGVFDLIIRAPEEERIEATIMHASGHVVFTLSEKTEHKQLIKEMDLSSLPAGVYFVRVTGSHSQAIKKLIIR